MHSIFAKCMLICAVLITATTILTAQEETPEKEPLVYQFEITSDIYPAVWRKVDKAVDEAEELNADYILIRMNTYGGLVDAADSIRSKLLKANPTTIVFIDNNAASAGALISLACDSIYMNKGAQIGAATVVNQTGEQAPDKYQSYMRATMRSTAEAQNRDPEIAEAMVDDRIEIKGIIEKGKTLTFTTSEAIKHNFCEGEFNSIGEIKEHLGIQDHKTVQYTEGATEKLISFLLHPMVSSILLMMIFGGIYFELQTPGVGFPIAAAILGAVLYFAPNYIEGLAANWEILLFIAGLILIAIELFAIPGFGVAGVSGIILMMTSLVLSLLNNDMFDFSMTHTMDAVKAVVTVGVPVMLLMTLLLFLGHNILNSPLFKRIALEEVQESSEGYSVEQVSLKGLIGQQGIASTVLRPSGKVEINGELYDAITDGEWISPGENIKVVSYQSSYVLVKKIVV